MLRAMCLKSWAGRRLFAALLSTASASAQAVTVSPVVVDMQSSGRGVVSNLTVDNNGVAPLPVEIRVQALDFDEQGVKATDKDTGELLVVPPQALIQPGQTQSFRLQWVGEPALQQSRHFYVTVAQLPVELPQGQSAVQIVYNFQVLASVSSPASKPALTIQSAAIGDNGGKPAPVITVNNSGGAYGYVSNYRLKIVQLDSAGKELFTKNYSGPEFQQAVGYGLVAAGHSRKILVPVDLPSRTGTVQATLTEDRRR
jgi:fimbrial chaperone protein